MRRTTSGPTGFFDASGNMWMSFGSGCTTANRVRTINIIKLDRNTGLQASDKTIYSQVGARLDTLAWSGGWPARA